MSGKVPKALATSLRACKAALAAGDHAAALECCVKALGTPAGEAHYRLHVFAGAAAIGTGDDAAAERFLRRATELEPGDVAAWQGLEDLHAQQHAAVKAEEGSSNEASQGAEDRWVDSLERLAEVTAKRRKIDIKLARVLQGSRVVERRAEAWRMWQALLDTAKKEAQAKVPLEAAASMVMESLLVSSVSHLTAESGATALSAGEGVGDATSRCAVLAKYLDFRTSATSSPDEYSSDMSLVDVVERYVCEKLQGLSSAMGPAEHSELFSLRAFLLSRAGSVPEMDALLRKESLVHGCAVAPIFFEACLLPLLVSRGCNLCSQLDPAHGSELAKDSAPDGDQDQASDFAKFLLNEYPDRPVAHLWYACHQGASLSSSDAESALEHARLCMKGCGGDKSSKSKSASPFAKAAGPVVMTVVTAICRVRLSDLLLASPHGSILSGEGTTAPGSVRSKVLREVAVHADAGLSALASCTASAQVAKSNSAATAAAITTDPATASPSLLSPIKMVQQALRICKAVAAVRRAAPGHRGLVLATSVLSSMPVSATPSEETIRSKLMSAATLCAIESDVQSGNFKEARRRGNDYLESGECRGFVLAATTALLALADFCEGKTAASEGASVAGFEKALATFRSSSTGSSSGPAAVHLSACLHFWLARAMWRSGDEEYRKNRKFCFENLIAAAKLKPGWGAPFGLLGQYYMTLSGKSNAIRGEKCLERALAANPCLEDAGALLANVILKRVAESQRVDMQAGILSYPFVAPSEDKDTASTIQRARTLYESAIERSGGHAIWAWRGLGVMHMSVAIVRGNPSDIKSDRAQKTDIDVDGAIECFQSLLRLCPNDIDGWERLGHTYAMASRYTAALKSFETVLSLSPGRPTALRGLAEVELAMGSLEECTSHLREALVSLERDDMRKMLGHPYAEEERLLCERSLSVSLLAQARIQLSSDMFSLARDSAAEGLVLAQRLQHQRPGMVSPRKLVGDLHALLGALPASVMPSKYDIGTLDIREEQKSKIISPESTSGDEIWRDGFAKKKAHLEAAVAAFRSVLAAHDEHSEQSGDAIRKRKDHAAAWMDLGIGLFRLCQANRNNQAREGSDEEEDDARENKNATGTDPESSSRLVDETRSALKHAIFATRGATSGTDDSARVSTVTDLSALAADAWNVLGVVETEMAWPPRPLVAQYAYVRAMSLSNGNHAHAWSNLGFLYLKCGFTKRAMAAFMTSQSLAPASSIMWCGLGIISAGRGNEQKRALESYKCAMEYFPHLQAKLGMGLAAMHVGDYATAMGSLQRAVDENPCDASTRNALALALSQLGDADGARDEFSRAEMLLEFQVSEHANSKRDGGMSRLNIGLAQIKANKAAVSKTNEALAISPPVVQLSQEILVERAASLLAESQNVAAGDGSADTSMEGGTCETPKTDISAQRAEQSIQMLLHLSETRWWNRLSSFSTPSALRDVTDVISGLWMQLARRLMTENDSKSAVLHEHCLSCVRFAICVAGHGGSTSLITEALIYLGSLLRAPGVAVKEQGESEAREEDGEGSTFASRAGVFLRLARRPRWINLPLATRVSCHGAATARAALTYAIRVDPSCQPAWNLLSELPSP